jgi:hypothetical protein
MPAPRQIGPRAGIGNSYIGLYCATTSREVNTGVQAFVEPISRPQAELEVGSSVSIEAALRDHITDQLIPLEISVQLAEVNAITVQ